MANFQSKYVKLCSMFCPGIWEGRPRYNFSFFFNRHALLWLVDIILEEMLVTSKSDPASKVITWWWQTCVLFCLFCIFFACSLCFLYFKNIFWWKIIVIRPLKCISWWWQTCVLFCIILMSKSLGSLVYSAYRKNMRYFRSVLKYEFTK